MGLGGHVVVTANTGHNYWIFDPDFDVIIPYNIEYIQQNPEIIKKYYSNLNFQQSTLITPEKIVDIYSGDGNVIYPSNIFFGMSYGYIDCNWKKVAIERLSYIFKWIFPISLMIPFILLRFRKTHA